MAQAVSSDLKSQTLDARVANLEKMLQVNGDAVTIRVGSSKVVISSSEIRLETSAAITIKCSGNLNIESAAAANIKASGALTVNGKKTMSDDWST